MNPYLYCPPNWGDVNERNVKDLEEKIIALAPQHVRIFVLPRWWRGQGDTVCNDGELIKQSMIRTIRLAQRAGATINLTLWFGQFPYPAETAKAFVDMLADL